MKGSKLEKELGIDLEEGEEISEETLEELSNGKGDEDNE